ncbi:hypothetical protein EYF80_023008 [Liparis tanakae]|uniref:Uncharacterized protein n=1 Tax=Liparis tanakae TaxID=230148 RepID=A0A4Z2HLQ9_9TELE|nr:hypothetical protein EYF80_023008 [Liparis tanakae]
MINLLLLQLPCSSGSSCPSTEGGKREGTQPLTTGSSTFILFLVDISSSHSFAFTFWRSFCFSRSPPAWGGFRCVNSEVAVRNKEAVVIVVVFSVGFARFLLVFLKTINRLKRAEMCELFLLQVPQYAGR